MKLNNVAVSIVNFFVKASFWLLTLFCVAAFCGAVATGTGEGVLAVLLFWVVGVIVWAFLSAGWLVLSKIAGHLESIDGKTRIVWVGHSEGPTVSEKIE